MKKMVGLLLVVMLGGCSMLKATDLPETSNKDEKQSNQTDMNEEKMSKEEYEAVVAELKQYDRGKLDYEGQELCLHPRGIYEKGNCRIEIKSEPHIYFVYNFTIHYSQMEDITISIDSEKALEVITFLKDKGFVRTDM